MYDPYVRSLVNRFSFYKSKDDLYQAGFMGLIMAYKNYDKNYNVKFTTYAYPYILGEIKKVLNDNTLKYSKQLISLKFKIDKVTVMLTQKLMRCPCKKEIIDILGISEYEYDEVMQMNSPISLDKEIGDDLALYEVIGKEEFDKDSLIALRDSLKSLSKEEKKLIDSRYLYGESQREVASGLNTNQVDVSRREKKILSKLKTNLKS